MLPKIEVDSSRESSTQKLTEAFSLEEARACYPANKIPSDKTLQKLIKFFTWAANSEYDLLIEEKTDENK